MRPICPVLRKPNNLQNENDSVHLPVWMKTGRGFRFLMSLSKHQAAPVIAVATHPTEAASINMSPEFNYSEASSVVVQAGRRWQNKNSSSHGDLSYHRYSLASLLCFSCVFFCGIIFVLLILLLISCFLLL